jgi:hypothetical protein
MFKTNVGNADRIVRIALGVVLIAVYFLFPGNAWWAVLSLVVGLVALVTGFMSTCPLYSLLGISTCPVKP